MLDLINSSVRDLKKYHLTPENTAIKLNQNENPFDWPVELKKEIAEFCVTRPWNRYPEFIPVELKRALALHAGVREENILAGNGSNEMFLVLLIALSITATPVIICRPTFTVYTLLVNGLGRTVMPVFLDKNLRFDLDAITAASTKNPTGLMILCSPNNPTGSDLTQDQIRAILGTHKGFVILDQAYVEFGGFNAITIQKEYPNLIVTRTFSKACSGAGLRLGYLVGAPEIITELNKIKLPYNINFFSIHVALAILPHKEFINRNISYLIEQRALVFSALETMPLVVYPSAANFILIRSMHKNALFEHLRDSDSILVRDVSSYPMLENCLRISIGTAGENELLIQSIRRFFDTKVQGPGKKA
jgi:histidinol-phosphate aminotransferase